MMGTAMPESVIESVEQVSLEDDVELEKGPTTTATRKKKRKSKKGTAGYAHSQDLNRLNLLLFQSLNSFLAKSIL